VSVAAVILAAGQGTRMRSSQPKVVHQVAGRPMVQQVVRTVRAAGADPIVVVVGYGADAVRSALAGEGVHFALQSEQLGTGHALSCARGSLANRSGWLLVLNGDGPLVRASTLQRLIAVHGQGPPGLEGRGMTLATARVAEPRGLGRIVRNSAGRFEAIVEDVDADDATRRLHEINPGVYLLDDEVWSRLDQLGNANMSGERYITDLPAAYLAGGLPVRTVEMSDPDEALAANDRVELARLERIARARIAERWMRAGVTLRSPETTWIDDDVVLGRDVVIEPLVILRRGTQVGEGAHIGAAAHLTDCRVAAGAVVAPHRVAVGIRVDSEERVDSERGGG